MVLSSWHELIRVAFFDWSCANPSGTLATLQVICLGGLQLPVGYQAYFAPVQKSIPWRPFIVSLIASPLMGGNFEFAEPRRKSPADWTRMFVPAPFRNKKVCRASRLRQPCGPTP